MYRYIIATRCIEDCLKISISDYFWKIDEYFWVFYCFFSSTFHWDEAMTTFCRPYLLGVLGLLLVCAVAVATGQWAERPRRNSGMARCIGECLSLFFNHLHIQSRLKFWRQNESILQKKWRKMKKNASGMNFFFTASKKKQTRKEKMMSEHTNKHVSPFLGSFFHIETFFFRELKRTVLVSIFLGILYGPAVSGRFLDPPGNHPRGAISPTVD